MYEEEYIWFRALLDRAHGKASYETSDEEIIDDGNWHARDQAGRHHRTPEIDIAPHKKGRHADAHRIARRRRDLQRYYEPLRHPKAPGLSLAGIRLVIAGHTLGLPVLRTLSLCTCCRHYPGAAAGRTLRSASPSRISLPRKGCRVGLRIVLFEACSAFTRVTACTLALSPIRDTLTEGFSHFVSSMTAPVASGWSGCRVGFAPTGKRRLWTAHTHSGRCSEQIY